IGENLGVEFDLDNLLRMDAATQMDVLEKSKGKLTPNEQRKRLNLGPKPGGDTIYLQEQDHSLEWLARRDALPIEPPAPEPVPPAVGADSDALRAFAAIAESMQRAIEPVVERVEGLEASHAGQGEGIAAMPGEFAKLLPPPADPQSLDVGRVRAIFGKAA